MPPSRGRRGNGPWQGRFVWCRGKVPRSAVYRISAESVGQADMREEWRGISQQGEGKTPQHGVGKQRAQVMLVPAHSILVGFIPEQFPLPPQYSINFDFPLFFDSHFPSLCADPLSWTDPASPPNFASCMLGIQGWENLAESSHLATARKSSPPESGTGSGSSRGSRLQEPQVRDTVGRGSPDAAGGVLAALGFPKPFWNVTLVTGVRGSSTFRG